MDFAPPAALQAEVAVLGHLMNRQDKNVLGVLSARDFTAPEHAEIFEAVRTLITSNTPADLRQVSDYLANRERLIAAGGREYITDVYLNPCLAGAVEYYVKDLTDKTWEREARRLLGSLDNGTSVDSVRRQIARMEPVEPSPTSTEVSPEPEPKSARKFHRLGDAAVDLFAKLQERCKYPNALSGVPSGLPELDEMTMGFRNGSFIVIGARTGVGKTVLAMNMAGALAGHYSEPTLFICLEMSAEELVNRHLAARAGVELDHMLKGTLNDEDWSRLYTARSETQLSKLIIVDQNDGVRTLADMHRCCNELEEQLGVRFEAIYIDHIGIIPAPSGEFGNALSRVTEVSRGLKDMAAKLDRPVIALCQLSRPKPGKEGQPPQLSDLRDSGTIEQDCDMALMLHHPYYYNKDADRSQAFIYIRKNRHGRVGEIEIAYDSWCGRIRSKYGKAPLRRMKDAMNAQEEQMALPESNPLDEVESYPHLDCGGSIMQLETGVWSCDKCRKTFEGLKKEPPKTWSREACQKRAAKLMTENQYEQEDFWNELGTRISNEEATPETWKMVEEEYDKLMALANANQPPDDFFADDEDTDFFKED